MALAPEDLRNEAKAKGYNVVRTQPGNGWLIMELSTGRSVVKCASEEEARDRIKSLAVQLPPVPVEVVPVGWTAVQQNVGLGTERRCPNGWGPMCLCVSDWEDLFCAVKTCHQKAGCQGACVDHYSQLKLFGDLTAMAYEHTQVHLDKGEDLEELKHDPRKISIKRMGAGPGWTAEPHVAVPQLGIIGAQIRAVGVDQRWWQIIDKDGFVISEGPEKGSLIREFLGDE